MKQVIIPYIPRKLTAKSAIISAMRLMNSLFTGFFGLILVILFVGIIIMWFCAPVLLYLIYQKLGEIEKKISNK
jgi:hypothetical protein